MAHEGKERLYGEAWFDLIKKHLRERPDYRLGMEILPGPNGNGYVMRMSAAEPYAEISAADVDVMSAAIAQAEEKHYFEVATWTPLPGSIET